MVPTKFTDCNLVFTAAIIDHMIGTNQATDLTRRLGLTSEELIEFTDVVEENIHYITDTQRVPVTSKIPRIGPQFKLSFNKVVIGIIRLRELAIHAKD